MFCMGQEQVVGIPIQHLFCMDYFRNKQQVYIYICFVWVILGTSRYTYPSSVLYELLQEQVVCIPIQHLFCMDQFRTSSRYTNTTSVLYGLVGNIRQVYLYNVCFVWVTLGTSIRYTYTSVLYGLVRNKQQLYLYNFYFYGLFRNIQFVYLYNFCFVWVTFGTSSRYAYATSVLYGLVRSIQQVYLCNFCFVWVSQEQVVGIPIQLLICLGQFGTSSRYTHTTSILYRILQEQVVGKPIQHLLYNLFLWVSQEHPVCLLIQLVFMGQLGTSSRYTYATSVLCVLVRNEQQVYMVHVYTHTHITPVMHGVMGMFHFALYGLFFLYNLHILDL